MTSKTFDQNIRELVLRDIASLPVPPCDLAAIHARARENAGVRPVAAPSRWRIAIAGILALGVVALGIPSVSAVVAQAQRVWQAFTIHDGKRLALVVQEVGLDQARADMPFRVIAPAAIPAGMQATIRELRSTGSPADDTVVFEYRDPSANSLPGIVITETAARRDPAKTTVRFLAQPRWRSRLSRGPLNQPHRERRMIKLDTTSWIVRGTQIKLLSAPGALTPKQVGNIRGAMSR